jgi:glucokinase
VNKSAEQDTAKKSTHPLDWSSVLAERGNILGVDISGSGERVALADVRGNIIGRDAYARPDNGEQRPPEVLERVTGMMRRLLEANDIKPREVLRAGVGFGGPVDAARGLVRLSHDYQGWEDYPLAAKIESAFDVPTLLDNDARLGALGEVWFGAGQGDPNSHLVYVHWSRGVGGGIVAGGRLVRGDSTIGGEIGHTTVRTGEAALPCRCGGRGHLEVYVRGPAIIERARAMLETSGSSLGELTVASIFAGADKGKDKLEELVGETVDLMALTIGNLITVFNPARVVIGGQVARDAGPCIPRIADAARAYAMPLSARNVEIVPATLGEDSGVMGAIALGLDSLR